MDVLIGAIQVLFSVALNGSTLENEAVELNHSGIVEYNNQWFYVEKTLKLEIIQV